jgi:hypothetical protein
MPQDVCFSDLKFIIEFVYRGEIDVSQAELQVCNNNSPFFQLLQTAVFMLICGAGYYRYQGTISTVAY